MQSGIVSAPQVEQLLQEQQRWGGRLVQLVVEQGLANEDQLVQLFHREMRFPVITWDRLRHVPPDVVKLVPVALCESYDVFPVACELHSRRLRMAMSDPSDATSLRTLQDKCGMQIDPVVASVTMIRWAIRLYYYGEQLDTPGVGTRPPSSYGGAPPSSSRPIMPYGASGEVSRAPLPPSGTPLWNATQTSGIPTKPTGVPPSATSAWQTGNYTATAAGGHAHGAQPSGIYPVSPGNLTGTHAHIPHVHPGMYPGLATGGSLRQVGTTSAVAQISPSVAHEGTSAVMASAIHTSPPQGIAVATAKDHPDPRLISALREMQQLRQEFIEYKTKTQQDIQNLQDLLTHRFHEHRLMMRGLFDLLVARGYVSKEELVEMLSAIQASQPNPSGSSS